MKTAIGKGDRFRTPPTRFSSEPEGETSPGLRRRVATDHVLAWSVMAGVTVFVLWQLYPSLVVRNTPPADGDLAGHMHVARHLRDHLLPEWRLGGWSQDW